MSPTTYTLISAATGDRMPSAAVEISAPNSPVSWEALPDYAKCWAEMLGYGGEAELLYVAPGEIELDGWRTLVVDTKGAPDTDAARRVDSKDPRVHQLAEAMHAMEGHRPITYEAMLEHRADLVRSARMWLRAAVAAGLLPAELPAEAKGSPLAALVLVCVSCRRAEGHPEGCDLGGYVPRDQR